MLLWVILFIITIALSAYLAWRSMKNYRERPHHFRTDSGIYLIQNPANFNETLVNELFESSKAQKLILSFERLFKGDRQALIVYGPSSLLMPYKDSLSLLELNDYTQRFTQNTEGLVIWEMISKELSSDVVSLPVADNLELVQSEQFWWQIVVQPSSGDYVIRGVIIGQNDKRSASLHSHLSAQLSKVSLIPIPRAHKKSQMVDFYKDRALGELDKSGVGTPMSSKQVLSLLKVFS